VMLCHVYSVQFCGISNKYREEYHLAYE